MNQKLTKLLEEINRPDPRTINTNIDIDPKIKQFIKIINKSNGIYTLYSCQGHIRKYKNKTRFETPYIVWIVRKNKINIFLNELIKIIPLEKQIKQNPMFLFSNSYNTNIEFDYHNKDFQIITTRFDKKCIDNQTFYDNLENMAKKLYKITNRKNNK
jgi:hypothetical protein